MQRPGILAEPSSSWWIWWELLRRRRVMDRFGPMKLDWYFYVSAVIFFCVWYLSVFWCMTRNMACRLEIWIGFVARVYAPSEEKRLQPSRWHFDSRQPCPKVGLTGGAGGRWPPTVVPTSLRVSKYFPVDWDASCVSTGALRIDGWPWLISPPPQFPWVLLMLWLLSCFFAPGFKNMLNPIFAGWANWCYNQHPTNDPLPVIISGYHHAKLLLYLDLGPHTLVISGYFRIFHSFMLNLKQPCTKQPYCFFKQSYHVISISKNHILSSPTS